MSSRRRSSLVTVHADKGRGEQEASVPLSGMLILLVVLAGIAAIWINEFTADEDDTHVTTLYRTNANKKPQSRNLHQFLGVDGTSLQECECEKVVTDALHYYVEKHTRGGTGSPPVEGAKSDDDTEGIQQDAKPKKSRSAKTTEPEQQSPTASVKTKVEKRDALNRPESAPPPSSAETDGGKMPPAKDAKSNVKEAKAAAAKTTATAASTSSSAKAQGSKKSESPAAAAVPSPAKKVAVKVESEEADDRSDDSADDSGVETSEEDEDEADTDESHERDISDGDKHSEDEGVSSESAEEEDADETAEDDDDDDSSQEVVSAEVDEGEESTQEKEDSTAEDYDDDGDDDDSVDDQDDEDAESESQEEEDKESEESGPAAADEHDSVEDEGSVEAEEDEDEDDGSVEAEEDAGEDEGSVEAEEGSEEDEDDTHESEDVDDNDDSDKGRRAAATDDDDEDTAEADNDEDSSEDNEASESDEDQSEDEDKVSVEEQSAEDDDDDDGDNADSGEVDESVEDTATDEDATEESEEDEDEEEEEGEKRSEETEEASEEENASDGDSSAEVSDEVDENGESDEEDDQGGITVEEEEEEEEDEEQDDDEESAETVEEDDESDEVSEVSEEEDEAASASDEDSEEEEKDEENDDADDDEDSGVEVSHEDDESVEDEATKSEEETSEEEQDDDEDHDDDEDSDADDDDDDDNEDDDEDEVDQLSEEESIEVKPAKKSSKTEKSRRPAAPAAAATEEVPKKSPKKKSPPAERLTLDGVRSRAHIAEVLGFETIGTEADHKEEKLIAQILKNIKKAATDSIKPLEKSYKFSDISQRVLGDAEIFNKPMALFIGPWSSGKSTAINYLLGTDNTRAALKTGPQPTDSFFTVIHHNDNGIIRESGLKMAGDWAFSGVNKFGQAFLSHFRGIGLSHPLLQKVTIVDTPGIIDGRRFKDFPLEDVFQWFIDRADAIYVVFDPSKLEIGADMKAMLDQLRGKEQQTRFLLNKADLVEASEVTRVTGQLLWNVSPLLGSSDAPTIYTVSMINRPYLPGSPAEYLKDQEEEFLSHLKEVMDERVENTIMYARRHAVRVRNHAKLVDCYLDAFYKQKGMFGNKKKVAEQVIKDPAKYNIFDTISQSKNISRYDLLEPEDYAAFFKLNPLPEFSRLTDLCGFVKGCPIDKLDRVIANELPQLLTKYQEKSSIAHDSEERGDKRSHVAVKVPTKSKKTKSK